MKAYITTISLQQFPIIMMINVFKKTIKFLVPPVFIWLYRKIYLKFNQTADDPDALFKGDDELFKRIVKQAKYYGEYGCGKSTKWVLDNTLCDVIAIETSRQWVDIVKKDNKKNDQRLTIKHAECGTTGNWGRPVDFSKRYLFQEYTDFLWRQDLKPDVVLIDGRFRVCCFLTCLKYADEGTNILFDDYVSRPQYHIVEEYAERVEVCGRQCLFVVPPKQKIDFDKLNKDIDSFRHVIN